MYILIAIVFVLGYICIALEHPLNINKAASALLTAVLCWTLFVFGGPHILSISGEVAMHIIDEELMHHLGEIGSILFFLLGAMTVVELIDAHNGFSIITERITTSKKTLLLITLSFITFFMSAALDNLTTSIVMAALLRKLIHEKEDLWLFGGMIIIAANAGGAWSPIGDVTTIMLWIGGQISGPNIVVKLFIPSLICMVVPLAFLCFRIEGNIKPKLENQKNLHKKDISNNEKKLVFSLGIGALLFVPVFKTVTHLPPFLGVLLGLSILWAVTDQLHKKKDEKLRSSLSISGVIQRVDTPSILFFLGILLAVAALQSAGHLDQMADYLNANIGNIWIINVLIGFLSSIIDNVPLVAGAIGMYELSTYAQDHIFWELLAYCAGTGGSCLIIGSAAGVAMMGILKIDFIWYMKKISLLAIAGYLAGVTAFYFLNLLY